MAKKSHENARWINQPQPSWRYFQINRFFVFELQAPSWRLSFMELSTWNYIYLSSQLPMELITNV
jgi:hypothetical protein